MSHWESNGRSDEWRTPKYIFDALDVTFDLDAAAPVDGVTYVPCRGALTARENALSLNWRGFTWLNPPFGGRNSLSPWLLKFINHADGIALVPDRTSAPWFQFYGKHAAAILFISPKVKFLRPDGSPGASPSTGTALWAMGWRGYETLIRAQALGLLVRNI